MSQQSTEPTNEGPSQPTQPVSETAEQGTPADERTPAVQDEGVTGSVDAQVDGDEEKAQPDGTGTETRTVTDGSTPTDVSDDEKPVWNVETHGPLGEDDPRRGLYRVVGE